MQRKSQPLVWRPKGLSDTLDASSSFKGAMSSLQNLIPDPSTSMLWQCRPASQFLHSFGANRFISAYKIVGDIAYGMIASANVPGHDEPFAFNLRNNQVIAVGGAINVNTLPFSLLTAGAWAPPIMDVVGPNVLVAHSGFRGVAGNYIGWFDISNPLTPVWHTGNLTGPITFTVAPIAVAQFGQRAYWMVNVIAAPAVVFSDVLLPLQCTSGTQVLTFGDTVPLTAFGALPLNNQLGGIIQALMVFKDSRNIYQITGDAALGTLAVNALNVATGTQAPLTVVPTPKGLAFMSPDGMRFIDFNAHVSDPVGTDGQGISVPFINSAVPSRTVAACSGDVLRVSTQNNKAPGSPVQEYWYDFPRGIWSGPHTFPAALIQPYGSTFILAPSGVLGSLWQSDVAQSSVSSYVENGVPLAWTWQTAFLPDTDQMVENAMTEAVMDFALQPGAGAVTVSMESWSGAVLDQVTLSPSGGTTLWGSFTWGAAPWGGAQGLLQPYQVNWNQPNVFSRMQIKATGQSGQGVQVGALHMRYQQLGYLTNAAVAA